MVRGDCISGGPKSVPWIMTALIAKISSSTSYVCILTFLIRLYTLTCYSSDIDECARYDDCIEEYDYDYCYSICGENTVCINTIGDYNCTCAEGYYRNYYTYDCICESLEKSVILTQYCIVGNSVGYFPDKILSHGIVNSTKFCITKQ